MSDIDIFAKTSSCVDIKNKVVDAVEYEKMKAMKLETELTKYKRAFEILKYNLEITKTNNIWKQPIIEIRCNMFVTPEQAELLEELMKDDIK